MRAAATLLLFVRLALSGCARPAGDAPTTTTTLASTPSEATATTSTTPATTTPTNTTTTPTPTNTTTLPQRENASQLTAEGTTSASAGTSSSISDASAPGPWTLQFEGQGPVLARIDARGFTEAEWAQVADH